MYILNQKKDVIHSSADIQRFTITEKSGKEGTAEKVWLICASLSTVEPLITLGRYYDEETAKSVFMSLYVSLASGAAYFDFPNQNDMNEDVRIRDARTKRRGGS